jgi:hypothetical protein
MNKIHSSSTPRLRPVYMGWEYSSTPGSGQCTWDGMGVLEYSHPIPCTLTGASDRVLPSHPMYTGRSLAQVLPSHPMYTGRSLGSSTPIPSHVHWPEPRRTQKENATPIPSHVHWPEPLWQGGSWSHSDFTHKTGFAEARYKSVYDHSLDVSRAGCACEAWAGARRESTTDVCVRGWNPEMLVVDDRPDFFAGASVFAPAFALLDKCTHTGASSA